MAKRNPRASSHSDAPTDVNDCSELIDLPGEIVSDIMSRLSIESLIRFKSLSKPWCSVIRCLVRDPAFVAQHHRQAETRPTFLLINQPRPQTEPFGERDWIAEVLRAQRRSVTLITDFVETAGEIRCVTKHIDGIFHLPGSSLLFHCNGIVCQTSSPRARDIYDQTMTLYNPVMNEFSTFRPKPVAGDNERAIFAMGFGSDSGSMSFKFVRILVTRLAMMTAQVYDISDSDDHSWREIEFPAHLNKFMFTSSFKAVYAKGHCHWLVESPPMCLRFDMAAESFRAVDLPIELGEYLTYKRLVAHEGSLCLVNHPPQRPMDIWVMDDNDGAFSWSNWLRIDCPSEGIRKPFCFWRSDELLMKTNGGDVVSYNIGSKAYKRLSPDRDLGYIHRLSPLIDSLASVKQEIIDLFRRV